MIRNFQMSRFDDLAETFREQAVGLIQGGVDVLLIETSQDILEVKAAITGIHEAFDETQVYLPIQAQVTLDTTGRMLLGTDMAAALAILEGMGIDVIGLNCSTGPEHMREPIRILGENSTLPVSCIPNAGLPLNVDGQAVYPLEPEPFANDLYEFVTKHNISVVGGCCGTTSEHLRLLDQKLDSHPATKRPLHSTPQLASAMSAISMRQDPPPTLLGERLNAQGSRKFSDSCSEDYDSILEIAANKWNMARSPRHFLCCHRTPRRSGTHAQGRQETRNGRGCSARDRHNRTRCARSCLEDCAWAVSHQLDTSRIRSRQSDKIFTLAKTHNAAVIVLTIDEGGMAKTREKKLEVAKRIYDIAVNDHGLKPEDLVYDA